MLKIVQQSAKEASAGQAYWAVDAAELMTMLGTRPDGLSQAEAVRRLKRYGENTVKEHGRTNALRLLLRQFESPLVLILIFGAHDRPRRA